MSWNCPLTSSEMEQALAGAAATKKAAEEILAIAIERLCAATSNPDEWTGARLAQLFMTAAYIASQQTSLPMPLEQYAAMTSSHANAVRATI